MLVEIQDAITKRIKDRLSDAIRSASGGHDVKPARPSVDVFTDDGRLSSPSSGSLQWKVTSTVQIKFKDVSSDEARRKGVYLIVEGIVALIAGKTLGLPISPLVPTQYGNVSTGGEEEGGTIVFQISFNTSFTTNIADDEDEESTEDLISIGVGLYMRDTVEGEPDEEAEIKLTNQGGI